MLISVAVGLPVFAPVILIIPPVEPPTYRMFAVGDFETANADTEPPGVALVKSLQIGVVSSTLVLLSTLLTLAKYIVELSLGSNINGFTNANVPEMDGCINLSAVRVPAALYFCLHNQPSCASI